MNLNEAYEAFTSDPTQRLWFDELKWQLTLLCRAAMHDVFNYQERRDLADDAVSHIFANLYKYDGKSLFSTWAFAVARNCARMELRRMRRERNSTHIESFSSETLEEVARQLPPAIVEKLSVDERDLFFAMIRNNLNYRKAAPELSVHYTTVWRNWNKLLPKLRALLERGYSSSGGAPFT